MESKKLYQKLDLDFDLNNLTDDWKDMEYNRYISENFKSRYMGVLLDNSDAVESVFTAVFPSDKVLNEILSLGKENILLVTHHPMVWDIRNPSVFQNMNPDLLPKLKAKQISIYTLHVPLDKNGEYSTSTNLAKALDISIEGEFYEYFGAKVGVFGKTDLDTPQQIADKLSTVVGHKTKLWSYGSDKIRNHQVAVVGGGGNNVEGIEEIIQLGINTYVTGVTVLNFFSKNVHEFEIENDINLIGGTHYSTEKFACIALCKYFEKIGLSCKFIEGSPVLEDME